MFLSLRSFLNIMLRHPGLLHISAVTALIGEARGLPKPMLVTRRSSNASVASPGGSLVEA
jgi:triphosphoribosyl-dephospho-CoA synthetase